MRFDKIKFKIRNGIPENHSYPRFDNSRIIMRVTNGIKIEKIKFETGSGSLDVSIAYYMGILSGQLLTRDIHTLNLEVEIEIWEIE